MPLHYYTQLRTGNVHKAATDSEDDFQVLAPGQKMTVFLDESVTREDLRLVVPCPGEGCEEILKVDLLGSQYANCIECNVTHTFEVHLEKTSVVTVVNGDDNPVVI